MLSRRGRKHWRSLSCSNRRDGGILWRLLASTCFVNNLFLIHARFLFSYRSLEITSNFEYVRLTQTKLDVPEKNEDFFFLLATTWVCNKFYIRATFSYCRLEITSNFDQIKLAQIKLYDPEKTEDFYQLRLCQMIQRRKKIFFFYFGESIGDYIYL